jgi:serine/threonine protein kinase
MYLLSLAHRLTVRQTFARKIVRVIGQISRADLEKEARNIATLIKLGGHNNIIIITSHGLMKDYYFIDMELCDLTLNDYIQYFSELGSFAFEIESSMSPVFVEKGCSVLMRLNNIWTIGSHIARGLDFLHKHDQVHRDLKPLNGMTKPSENLLLVLYSRRANLWKLTDFGLSAEATSKKEHLTRYSRGTSNYRAPELLPELVENPTFTNKVDIWALGCIMYELVTLKKAFASEWNIQSYYNTPAAELPIRPFMSCPDFIHRQMSENIHDLLTRKSRNRPRTSEICRFFSVHCKFLELLNSQALNITLRAASNHPSYISWKEIVRNQSDDHQLLYSLANQYELNNEINAAAALRHALIESDALIKYRAAIVNGSTTSSMHEFMADIYIERSDYDEAIRLYKAAIVERPEEFLLWHKLCRGYLEKGEVEVAITSCLKGIKKYPTIPSPKLALVCLYAARGDYQKAVSGFHGFVRQCMASGQEDYLRSFKEKLKLTFPLSDNESTSRRLIPHIFASLIAVNN